MDTNKELEEIFNDPLLDISEKEAELFDVPADMRKVMAQRKKADHVAQRKLCEDFDEFRPLFEQIHRELKNGQRSLIKITKTLNFQEGHFYVVEGQFVLLQSIKNKRISSNGLQDGRTRCIFDNGTESDILLQTLRKNVVESGYAVTDPNEETVSNFFNDNDLAENDRVTGHIYVLRSLSQNPSICSQPNLYKIGFSTNSVEERISNAAHDPTYLMAPVEIVASYKVVNLHSQKFEDMIHQVLKVAQFHVTVVDDEGVSHLPKEWFVVPLKIVDTIIGKILDGTIVGYTYNPDLQCLEKPIVRKKSTFDTTGMKVLVLNIKKENFDAIMEGTKTIEFRELKQTTLNKYTYLDEADGKRYLRRYDALRLFVGYHKDRESALVQVVDTIYSKGRVEYHLGAVLECLR